MTISRVSINAVIINIISTIINTSTVTHVIP